MRTRSAELIRAIDRRILLGRIAAARRDLRYFQSIDRTDWCALYERAIRSCRQDLSRLASRRFGRAA